MIDEKMRCYGNTEREKKQKWERKREEMKREKIIGRDKMKKEKIVGFLVIELWRGETYRRG